MSNGFDGISSLNNNVIPPNNQMIIQRDTRMLSQLTGMVQTDGIQHEEASVMAQLNEALLQGQNSVPMTEAQMAQELAGTLQNGYSPQGASPYAGAQNPYNAFSNYGDPLEALSPYGDTGYGYGHGNGNGFGGGNGYGPGMFPGPGLGPAVTPNPFESIPGFQPAGDGSGPYGAMNNGFGQAETQLPLDQTSSLSLNGHTQTGGSINGQQVPPHLLATGHDNLFDANGDINGGFQVGNVTGVGEDGHEVTKQLNLTVQGHKITVDAEEHKITVDGKEVGPGETSGPVTVENDGSVNITGYNDKTGAQVHANIKGNEQGGLDLTLDQMQNIHHAGGALITSAEQPSDPAYLASIDSGGSGGE